MKRHNSGGPFRLYLTPSSVQNVPGTLVYNQTPVKLTPTGLSCTFFFFFFGFTAKLHLYEMMMLNISMFAFLYAL